MKARWTSAAALAGLLLAAAGCSEFNPSGVRAKMTSLVNQNKFQEAREVKVKGYPPGVPKKSSEELTKEQLEASLVNPKEAEFTADRIRTLERRVQTALEQHDDEGARDAIYDYGITDQRAVNAVTFLAKCAYLNSRVNPATLRKWELFAKRYVDGSIAAGDYAKAAAAKYGHLDMVKYLVGQGCDVNSDAVHSVMPSLASAEHRRIADYLYSQGYRRKTQEGGRDAARGMSQTGGDGETGAMEPTEEAAGMSGLGAAKRAIADRFHLPGLGK